MQITVDTTGWTQEEKNYLQAAAVALLFQASVAYDDISVKDGTIDITNPLTDVSAILTASNLKNYITAYLEQIRIATEQAMIEAQAKEQELLTSEFKDIKLADIDAKIDAIQTLAQLKIALKKFIRFVIART